MNNIFSLSLLVVIGLLFNDRVDLSDERDLVFGVVDGPVEVRPSDGLILIKGVHDFSIDLVGPSSPALLPNPVLAPVEARAALGVVA